MKIWRIGASRKWSLAFVFVLLHVFFAVRAALPQTVICHRASGTSAVEFDTADGGCQCEECEHCRARRQASGRDPLVPGLEACRCRHEVIVSDVGHSSLRLPDRHPVFSPAAAPAEYRIEPPAPPRARFFVEEKTGPPAGPADRGSSLLRC